MEYQVRLTRHAKGEIEAAYLWYKRYDAGFADRWFRGLMNRIGTLQEKPKRCALARENRDFSQEIRQLVYGKSRSRYRIVFLIEDDIVYVLSIRHGAQSGLDFNPLDLEE